MRHFAANYIFNGEDLIKNSVISVNDLGEIIYVGKENEGLIERPFQIFYNGIISPGFVNTHCHLDLSDFVKSDEQGKGLVHFIKSVLKSRNADLDLEKIRMADKLMYEKGINLVGDIVCSDKTIDVKVNSKICYHNFYEVSGVKSEDAENRIETALNLMNAFQKQNLQGSLVPHSFYSVSETLLNSLVAKSQSEVVSIHFLESVLETELFSGKQNSLYYFLLAIDKTFFPLTDTIEGVYSLAGKFKKAKSLILVHNLEVDCRDIPNDLNCFFCLCPASNLYLHKKLPSSDLVYHYIDRLTIGTDSLSSNNDLDILSEIKLIANNYPNISLKDLLKIATKNGADALDHPEFGRLNVGLKPGVIIIENVDLINLRIHQGTNIRRIL